MTDILIGAADGYNWSQLKNWVLSSKVVNGKRVLLVYRMDDATKQKCLEHGVEIVEINHDIYGNPLNHDARVNAGAARTVSHEIRYFHAWQYLTEQKDAQYVVLTDTRDVIFQKNPIDFLHRQLRVNSKEYLLAPQEGILYKDEPWNANNMYQGYGGYVWEYMKEKPVYNCGTIAGKMPFFADFVHTLWSMTTGKHTYPADQCSFGLIVETTLSNVAVAYKCKHDEGWCCQCGTTADPHKPELISKLITQLPIMHGDGIVRTSTGESFCLVHQYERNPEWLKIIDERYQG